MSNVNEFYSLDKLRREQLKLQNLAMASPTELRPRGESVAPATATPVVVDESPTVESPVDHRRRLFMDSGSDSPSTPLSTITNVPKRNIMEAHLLRKFSEDDEENTPVSSSTSLLMKKRHLPIVSTVEDDSSQGSGFFGSEKIVVIQEENVSLLESLSQDAVTSIKKTSADLRNRADTEPLTSLPPEVDSSPDKENFQLDNIADEDEGEAKRTFSLGSIVKRRMIIRTLKKEVAEDEEAETGKESAETGSERRKLEFDLDSETIKKQPVLSTSPNSDGSCPDLDSEIPSSSNKSSPPCTNFESPAVNVLKRPITESSASSSTSDNSDSAKRRKLYNETKAPKVPKFVLSRSLSESIENVVDNVTGDKTRELLLPVIKNATEHYDLNPIDASTLADVIRGVYSEQIASYVIIDARYVYEYNGGHIVGAQNFGSRDEGTFFNRFLHPETHLSAPPKVEYNKNAKRNILIFHCEFSSARGPELMKKLRRKDRSFNRDNYPALYYPECYLLHKGYKEFFSRYPELCDPSDYVTMTDPKFRNEERAFRAKSKSWAGGTLARRTRF